MFPEITRDEVFRLETRRLWLRWPTCEDADEVAALAMHKQADQGSQQGVLVVARQAAAQSVARWLAEAAAGIALHLLIVAKSGQRQVIGVVHIAKGRDGSPQFDYCLHTDWRGQGFMTEAAQAMLDMAFMLGAVAKVSASPRVTDTPARRVLERCGFTFVGTGLERATPAPGLTACDLFCLDRKTWLSLKGWNLPGFGTDSPDPRLGLTCGA